MTFVARPTATRPSDSTKPNVSDIYRAFLNVRKGNSIVYTLDTPLPQNYTFSLGSQYTNPFSQPLSSFAGPIGDIFEQANAAVNGSTSLNRWLSGAQWSGGAEFTLEVPFVLQAYKDPKKEVLQDMRDLMMLVAPSESSNGFLSTPGPTIAKSGTDFADDALKISIQIGKFFLMEPCIITDVSEDFDTQMDVNGSPIGAVVRVQFRSFFTTTKRDLQKWFLGLNNSKLSEL